MKTPNISNIPTSTTQLQPGAHYVLVLSDDVTDVTGFFRIWGEFNETEYRTYCQHRARRDLKTSHVVCVDVSPHLARVHVIDGKPEPTILDVQIPASLRANIQPFQPR